MEVGELFAEAFHLAHKNFPEGGTCLEFGVSEGNTYIWQAKQIITKYKNSMLIGFDSWVGLPPETKDVWAPERHKAGEFASPKEVVETRLSLVAENDNRFKLVDGFFFDSLTSDLCKTIKNLIFVNIDVDIHISTIQLLDFVKPLLRSGVILYWDDWKDPNDKYEGEWGEHLAWKEWNLRSPEIKTKTLKTNQWDQRIMEIL